MPSVNPQKEILRQGCRKIFENNELLVDWSLLMACNWDCSYCFTHGQELPKFIPSLEQLKCAADNLLALNKSRYYLYLIGGEITMIPHFLPFISYLNEVFGDKAEIMLVTNGYRPWQYFERLISVSKNKLNISISIHTEYARLENLIAIAENISGRAALSFGLIYHLGRKEYARKIFNVLSDMKKEYRFGLNISPVLMPPDYTKINPAYTADDLAWMEKGNRVCALMDRLNGAPSESSWSFPYDYTVRRDGVDEELTLSGVADLLKQGYFDFKNMYCCQGIGYFHITHTGECLGNRCGQNIGPLADFFEPGAQLYKARRFPVAVQCALDNCVCMPHHVLPKFKDRGEAAAVIRGMYKELGLETA